MNNNDNSYIKPKTRNGDEQIREHSVTYDDYAAMPDDGNRYEVAGGKLELMTSPTTVHQLISFELSFALKETCESEFMILFAPIDVILSKTEVRQPDLVMIHRSRMSIVTYRGIEGSPDLVVEIMSPSSRKRDRVQKTKVYARHGVAEYWIVEPVTQTLEQYQLVNGAYELIDIYSANEAVRSTTIPCASFTMDDLFANIPNLSSSG